MAWVLSRPQPASNFPGRLSVAEDELAVVGGALALALSAVAHEPHADEVRHTRQRGYEVTPGWHEAVKTLRPSCEV